MKCSRCGTELAPGAAFCPACGNQVSYAGPQMQQPQMQQPQMQQPIQINTWMVPSILATIFCCLPFGIVSIVYASKANGALGAGDFQQAQENADKAKLWFWLAFGIGCFTNIIGFVIQVAAAAAEAAF